MPQLTRIILFCLVSLLVISCGGEDNNTDSDITSDNLPSYDSLPGLTLTGEYYNYSEILLPEHYLYNDFPDSFIFQHAASDLDNTPNHNTITNAGATLGRVLFYDKKLSANGTIACASCHLQSLGFSDANTLSVGFEGDLTRRHSMGIVNARFYESGKFFWDERADTLEDQVLMPFQDSVEMGLTLSELEEIVRNQSYYPTLFQDAFGDNTISSDRISRALAQFIRSIVSVTSQYDIERSQVNSPLLDFPGFTDQENLGKDLFFLPRTLDNGDTINCVGCHITEAFIRPVPLSDLPTTNSVTNGLDAESTDDKGIYEATGNSDDIGKFKVPSLKNIAIRPPYMHDGRFVTLDEVIDHYSIGVQKHINLAHPLLGSDGEPVKFNFTETEKEALIAFLNTLTDYDMISDVKYSNPFE